MAGSADAMMNSRLAITLLGLVVNDFFMIHLSFCGWGTQAHEPLVRSQTPSRVCCRWLKNRCQFFHLVMRRSRLKPDMRVKKIPKGFRFGIRGRQLG